MAFGQFFKDLWAGKVDHAMSDLFISQEEVDRGNELDSRIDELNRRRVAMGYETQEEYEVQASNITLNSFDGGLYDQEGTDLWGGFQEGAAEGLTATQAKARSLVGGGINNILAFVPWQIWVIGGLYLAWRFGLLQALIGKTVKRIAK